MNTIQQNTQQSNPQTQIYVNAKPVGVVIGSTFYKKIRASKHMLRSPRAIAFDQSALRDATQAGATLARVIDRETGNAYTATLDRIREKGAPLSRGYGLQWYLTLDYWSVNGAKPVADQRAAQTNKEIAELQLGLFAGVTA